MTSLQPCQPSATLCAEPTEQPGPAGGPSGRYPIEQESIDEHRRNIEQLRALGDDAEIRAAIARRLQLIAALTPAAA
jgi:hypothetical protein